ncbi:putative bifunctional diguanylate cyclase/phosphodiesterase [Pseudoalteromonas sp. T1lg23B]|uniref:putative bifunctional diguanylate cyclase/phosphodiesterase n=1 Tax=Pseudoalteromonas sp. T1lg23B TaxID=2077097 RepID=UPI001F3794FD|nr:GGDEF domain-containing phosphodiesterase [Pseudoalteromonas sp. T1lg23B]
MGSLALILVIAGVVGLCLSLHWAYKICQISRQFGWRVLFGLIVFFILGYSAFSAYLLEQEHVELLNVGLASILFFGSIFVLIINHMAHQSLQTLAKLVEDERFHAQTDFLTKLNNREHCVNSIDLKISQGHAFAVMLVDLNNFKQINDSVGHLFGDKVLIALSQRLVEALSPDSALFRMGGDEFVILIDGIAERTIYAQNNALIKALEQPLQVEDVAVDVHYSAGVSVYRGDQQSDCTSLLREADIAMYSAKRSRQSLVIFDEVLHKGCDQEFHISVGLKEAFAHHTLKVFYQPMVNAKSTEVHGVEALARWPQANGTMMMPEHFVLVAESSNLIRQLSLFVIQRVISDLPTLLACDKHLVVHINLSSHDFLNKELINLLASLLSDNQVAAKHITFELTESMMVADLAQTQALIEVLIDMGFAVSIDDFGTGFSSFKLLKDLPVSQIKIDRSFIETCMKDDKSQVIVETIMFMAKRLKCSVVAEGVNHDKVASYLTSLDCDYLQGFNICEALPLEECTKWIKSNGLVKSVLKKY